jgi:phospholipase D1/2
MKDNISRVADKVIHPVAVIKHGEFAANPESFDGDASERQDFDEDGNRTEGFASSIVPTLEEKTIFERRPSASHANGQPLFDLIEEGETGGEDGGPKEATVDPNVKDRKTILDEDKKASKRGVPRIRGDGDQEEKYGAPSNAVDNDDAVPNKGIERDDSTEKQRAAIAARKTLRKHLQAKVGAQPWSMPTPTPKINPNRFHDPLDETFWKDMWVATAVHNTEIFRKVFRCIPDDLVTTWAAYKAFANHAEKFNRTPEDVAVNGADEPQKPVHGGPGTQGSGGGGSGGGAVGQGKEGGKDGHGHTKEGSGKDGQHRKVPSTATGVEHDGTKHLQDMVDGLPKMPKSPQTAPVKLSEDAEPGVGGVNAGAENKREPSGPEEAWAQWEREDMEELLNEVRGHLGESLH